MLLTMCGTLLYVDVIQEVRVTPTAEIRDAGSCSHAVEFLLLTEVNARAAEVRDRVRPMQSSLVVRTSAPQDGTIDSGTIAKEPASL